MQVLDALHLQHTNNSSCHFTGYWKNIDPFQTLSLADFRYARPDFTLSLKLMAVIHHYSD